MHFRPQDYMKRYVNAEIPARDGTLLRADVYMPAGIGPFPAVVMRSPYLKSPAATPHYSRWGLFYASHGFAFVMCDVRGRGDSDGKFHPFFNEVADGFDTIEWVAAQPWCTGEVGMDGNSYNAHAAWMAVLSGAPHLKAMAVSGVPGDLLRHGTYSLNGIKSLYMVLWMFMTSGRTMQIPVEVYGLQKPYDFLPDLLSRSMQVPIDQIPDLLGFDGRDWVESLSHYTEEGYWGEMDLRGKLTGSQVAGLHITGWFDNNLPGTLAGFERLREEGLCPQDQFLLLGPWTHEGNAAPSSRVGDLIFEEDAAPDMLGLKARFFSHYLKHEGDFTLPQVQIYDMGLKSWFRGGDYPISDLRTLYLTPGKLAEQAGEFSHYLYDPRNPTPAPIYLSPGNCSHVTQRPDVVIFESDTLEQPLTVAGQPGLHMILETDTAPTDLMATLCDRYPDGRCLPLTFGGQKVDTVGSAQIHLQLPMSLHTFQPGHRILLLLQSAALPLYVPSRQPVRVAISGGSTISLPLQEK